jgi:hypothetical protein
LSCFAFSAPIHIPFPDLFACDVQLEIGIAIK